MHLTFADRVRATIIGGGASLVLAAATLAAPALAADQPTTTDTIGAHTHQIHGTVKTAVSAGGTSFTLTTRRYGDVAVTFIAPTTGHGHSHSRGKARSYELTNHDALTAGERLVVQGRTSADGKTFVARRVHVLPAANGDSNGNTNGGTNTNSSTSTNTNANGNGQGSGNDQSSNSQGNGDAHRTTHLVGTVVSANATSLSVKLADGTTPSVAITADTTIRPQGKTLADLTVGTKVTVVSKNGTATGIVVSPA